MKKYIFIGFLVICFVSNAATEPNIDYLPDSPFQYVPKNSVSTSDDAASLLLNPAGLGISRGFNLIEYGLVDFTNNNFEQNDAGIYIQAGRSGFGYTYLKDGLNIFHLGSGEHIWKGIYFGNTSHFSSDGYEAIDLGLMYRGFSWFSTGMVWKNIWARERNKSRANPLINISIAVRPMGNRLTFAFDNTMSFEVGRNGKYSDTYNLSQNQFIQVQTEPADGVRLYAGYDLKAENYQIGVSIGFGNFSVDSYHNLDDKGGYGSSLMGFHISEDIRRTMIKQKKPVFVEMAFNIPISDSPNPRVWFGEKSVTLRKVREKIQDMADNPDIKGIILKPDYFRTGTGMMEELVQAFQDFKKSGKKIYAFLDSGGDASYALACVADSIFLNSGGFLDVDGISFGIGFWKGLFDKIGVDAQFYRRADFKTAAEVYTLEQLSDSSRKALESVLEDIHAAFSGFILQGRGWTKERLDTIYDGGLYTAQMALEAGLIDGIFHPDQIEKKIKEVMGEDIVLKRTKKISNQWVYDWESGMAPNIALIYAEGPILPGKSSPSPFGGDKIIGSETTAKAIRNAREDKSVKAIVMRVNSPGGSVLASEDIWREVHRTTHPDSSDEKNKKPFIISMANVAGSGGYYISCAADVIVADPSTVTGSIGVLAGKISVGGLFEKIGFNIDVVKEQPHADQFGLHRSFSDEEGERMQAIVDSFYDMFLERVSEGRGLTKEQVNRVARGRIWSGVDAKEKGLVDELGGLDTALDIARKKAELKEGEYSVKIYKGVEELGFRFEAKSGSDLKKVTELFDVDLPVTKMLDRAKLINSERFLFLMDEELLFRD